MSREAATEGWWAAVSAEGLLLMLILTASWELRPPSLMMMLTGNTLSKSGVVAPACNLARLGDRGQRTSASLGPVCYMMKPGPEKQEGRKVCSFCDVKSLYGLP